jgi:hypothetical protein
MDGACITNKGGERNSYNILIGKREGKRRLERSMRRQKDDIEMDLKALGWESVGWIGFMWLRIQTSGRLL